jgi:hypothetical protein
MAKQGSQTVSSVFIDENTEKQLTATTRLPSRLLPFLSRNTGPMIADPNSTARAK